MLIPTKAHVACSALLAVLALSAIPSAAEGQGSMITRNQLTQMFESVGDGTDWDLSKQLAWGYFFTDRNKEALVNAAPILEKLGYRIVDIYLADKQSAEEADLWWLHIEKIETHSVDSLYDRNAEFYKFAQSNDIESYDGMDVGPVPPHE